MKKEVHLKKKEFQLLEFLMRNRDIVFSKEELYSRVWGLDSYGDYAAVAVHINRLREEIEDNPSDSKHIITVWGVWVQIRLVSRICIHIILTLFVAVD